MKYGVIVSDPPWEFRVWTAKGTGRNPEMHYDTMSIDDIGKMKPLLDQWAEPDCALFLWATYPNLPGSLRVMREWGFTYKTVAFTWVKSTKLTDVKGANPQRLWGSQYAKRVVYDKIWIRFHTGLGMWTRANPEIVLLGTRGNPRRVDKGVKNLIIAPVGLHSEKPDEMYRRVDTLIGPDVRKLDMFARRKREGWDVWGNEVGS